MTLLNWAQLAALIAAGVFFALKLGRGWLMVNVSLAGATERRSRGDGRDDLGISITVTKGGTAVSGSTTRRCAWRRPRAHNVKHIAGCGTTRNDN